MCLLLCEVYSHLAICAMLLYLKYVVSHRGKEGIYTYICDNSSALLLERNRENN